MEILLKLVKENFVLKQVHNNIKHVHPPDSLTMTNDIHVT
jgi:hypothetical protein